jgi:hypothetical protein
MEIQIQQLIVEMVSPAVMVSACGLMLLGVGNKYSRVIDRLREFGAEVRELKKLGPGAGPVETDRLRVLNLQIPDLFHRGRLLRNVVLFYYTAVALFVACSFTIPFRQLGLPNWVPPLLFCGGMASVLIAAMTGWRETILSYRLINLEVGIEEE